MFGGRLGIPEILLIMILLLVPNILLILAWWRIFTKAGHPPVLALVMLIPFAKFLVLMWFAFTDWPVQKRPTLNAQNVDALRPE